MTIFEPSLFIRELRIFSGTKTVYQQLFHDGVNVIWGANASGKTTILQFIYYAVGGNAPNWKPIAKDCDRVIAEIELNGELICTQRIFSDAPYGSMMIYFGNLSEALDAPTTDWRLFPYSRGKTGKESFSQIIFDAMNMPHVPTSDTNITMYQILRLIYQNQMTSPQKLFRDDEWDNKLTKQTVGEFLCGIYDPKLYEDQLKLRSTIKMIQSLNGEYKGLKTALGLVGEDFDISVIAQDQRSAMQEHEELQGRLKSISEATQVPASVDTEAENKLKKLKIKINKDSEKLTQIETDMEGAVFQLSDSTSFLFSLEENLEAFKQSESIQSILGSITFQYCPECFTRIPQDSQDHDCGLCKTHLPDGKSRGHRIRLQRELEMQISETKKINEGLNEEIREFKKNHRLLAAINKKEKTEYFSKKTTVVSFADQKVREISERIGWLDRQLEILAERFEIGKRIDRILAELAKHETTKSKLERKIELALTAQQKSKEEAYSLLSDTLVELLQSDLPREESFQNTRSVKLDFGEEEIYVDGQTRFAASSYVYLKNCFGLAMLIASTASTNFRFPRLLILDAIEDKGLEEDRIHNFHDLVLKHSKASKVKHQIILTSQTLSKSLSEDQYIIGRHYLDGDKALNFS